MAIEGAVHEDDGALDVEVGHLVPLLCDELIELLHHLEPVDDHHIDVGDYHVNPALDTVVDKAMPHDEVEGRLTALETLDVSFVADHFEHESDRCQVDKAVIDAYYRVRMVSRFWAFVIV